MLAISDLPAVNASLNSIATVLLAAGYYFIRHDSIQAHRACMVGALAVSALFLVSYLTYHTNSEPVRFTATGWPAWIYFPMLASHIILAMINLPMIVFTAYFAAVGKYEKHRALARWTWPIWMYVSVTGVLVYLWLYKLFPPEQITAG